MDEGKGEVGMKEIHDVDAHGFVRLVDTMGDDMSVVKAARVSYGNETKGERADKKLIHYLMSHNHGTPFEHIVFTFHIKCPIFVARQWFRHRIGSFNEISGRYTELRTELFTPKLFRQNKTDNHQASIDGDFSEDEVASMMTEWNYALDIAESTYQSLLEKGVAREQARAILPLGTYTEFYWTVNLRSLFNFLSLRTGDDAQEEMRNYAEKIGEISKESAEWCFEAFESQP
jgi:thymidylate synthase (FAD)|tara:strand:+ start:65 stop:757 length:693 start_codon:yes stop_codon:yes gene_type:complete